MWGTGLLLTLKSGETAVAVPGAAWGQVTGLKSFDQLHPIHLGKSIKYH